MAPPDQRDVIAFLSQPETHGLRAGRVERIDTHISIVFLAGSRAYKLKRAVTFPYLDYSSLDRRREACERELQLNRRTAPSTYRAVIAVTREVDGRLTLGGIGEPIEWLVEMARFDDALLLDRVAAAGGLTLPLTRKLAHAVAFFHDGARPRRDHGGTAAMRSVIDGNLYEMSSDPMSTLDPAVCLEIHAGSVDALERYDCLLEARRVHGLVRQCHGDLHLHNVFLKGDAPVLFDAIEFNDDLACIDVMYDLAFLLMDLWHRRLMAHANAAMNAYLQTRPDYRGLALLPLFLSCRAAIRAKVCVAEAAAQVDSAEAAGLRADARTYLTLARELLHPAAPRLVAVGGLSGSGKSTLAGLLAPSLGAVPGAVVVRTDVIRKQMFGVDPLHPLPRHAYDAAVTARVYARVLHVAEACIRSGHAAIVDAVFADPRHRRAVERVAAEAGVPFSGLWLEVPYEVGAGRLERRAADASDATPDVLRVQCGSSLGDVTWPHLDGRSFRPDVPVSLADLELIPTSGSS